MVGDVVEPDIHPTCEKCGWVIGTEAIELPPEPAKPIKLDIGCGNAKPDGWTGLDRIEYPGVDILWDFNRMPWPLKEYSVSEARAHHVIEHIPRVTFERRRVGEREFNITYYPFIKFMDEVWAVLVPSGQFHIMYPPAGSEAFYQDPTHCNPCNFKTWKYFDPEIDNGFFYQCYAPRPWKLVSKSVDSILMHYVVLEKR